jgi:hypothetical protein
VTNVTVEVEVIMKDYKWPSSKRSRAARRGVITKAVTFSVATNGIVYALSLLAPEGMWLALALFGLGCVIATVVVNDILNDK